MELRDESSDNYRTRGALAVEYIRQSLRAKFVIILLTCCLSFSVCIGLGAPYLIYRFNALELVWLLYSRRTHCMAFVTPFTPQY